MSRNLAVALCKPAIVLAASVALLAPVATPAAADPVESTSPIPSVAPSTDPATPQPATSGPSNGIQPVPPPVTYPTPGTEDPLGAAIERYAKDNPQLGSPVGELKAGPSQWGGSMRSYSNADVYAYTVASGVRVHALAAPKARYAKSNVNWIGRPTSDAYDVRDASRQDFENAAVYTTAAGTHGVSGAIGTYAAANGWVGWPTGEEHYDWGARRQEFQNGTVYSTRAGVHGLSGPIRKYTLANKWIGWPISEEHWAPAPWQFARVQHFEHVSLYSSVFGTFPVSGRNGNYAGAHRWVGVPIDHEYNTVYGGKAQKFENASVYSTAKTGAHSVTGAIRNNWWRFGGEAGELGYPLTDQFGTGRGGLAQVFEYGDIFVNPSTGRPHAVAAQVRDAYNRAGGLYGRFGYPVSDMYWRHGSIAQDFEGGTLVASTTHDRIVDFARAQVGKPYVYGAAGPNAYDCSGLTMASYASVGVSIPRTTGAQATVGRRVSVAEAVPGDLVLFWNNSHAGIYIGNDTVIHAPGRGRHVEYARMSSKQIASIRHFDI